MWQVEENWAQQRKWITLLQNNLVEIDDTLEEHLRLRFSSKDGTECDFSQIWGVFTVTWSSSETNRSWTESDWGQNVES